MDFSFTPEQEELRAHARAFLAERYPAERVVELCGGGREDSWPALAELGWTGVSIPEEHGGAGLGFLEEAVLFEELGRALYPGPYFATVALALPALTPELLEEVAAGRASWTLALHGAVEAREGPAGWRLSGVKELVPSLAAASHVVVSAEAPGGPALFGIVRPDRADAVPTVDETRPYGRLRLDGDEATLLVGPDRAGEVLERIRLRELVSLALEAVGVAERARSLAVDHVRTREQFGRPVGAYQAVSHPLADSFVETELARSLAYWAAWCVAEDDADAPVAAAAAKSQAAEAAVAACERAIQAHGGTGFTWEHFLHRLYKRALWIESAAGSGASHRAAVAAALLD